MKKTHLYIAVCVVAVLLAAVAFSGIGGRSKYVLVSEAAFREGYKTYVDMNSIKKTKDGVVVYAKVEPTQQDRNNAKAIGYDADHFRLVLVFNDIGSRYVISEDLLCNAKGEGSGFSDLFIKRKPFRDRGINLRVVGNDPDIVCIRDKVFSKKGLVKDNKTKAEPKYVLVHTAEGYNGTEKTFVDLNSVQKHDDAIDVSAKIEWSARRKSSEYVEGADHEKILFSFSPSGKRYCIKDAVVCAADGAELRSSRIMDDYNTSPSALRGFKRDSRERFIRDKLFEDNELKASRQAQLEQYVNANFVLVTATDDHYDKCDVYIDVNSVKRHDDHTEVLAKVAPANGGEYDPFFSTKPRLKKGDYKLTLYAFNSDGSEYAILDEVVCDKNGIEVDTTNSLEAEYIPDELSFELVSRGWWEVKAVRDKVF